MLCQKNINPANVPQLCPIEKFWANMTHEICKKGKIAAGINKFGVWHHKSLQKLLSKSSCEVPARN